MFTLSSLRKGKNVYFSGEDATYIPEVGRQMSLGQKQYPRLSLTVKYSLSEMTFGPTLGCTKKQDAKL